MIKSMTGYGGAKGEVEQLQLMIELKSVNNRYLDVSVRLPRSFIFAEDSIKSAVQNHISRGKADVFITVDSSAALDEEVKVNEPLLCSYLEALNSVAYKHNIPNDVSVMSICRMPDILKVEKRDADNEALLSGMLKILESALQEFDLMREREGEKLRDDVNNRIKELDRLIGIIEQKAPQTVADYRARLEQKMRDVLDTVGIEESRILAEAAIFADRVAVDEELVRLRSHISQLFVLIEGESPVGRKIDFLVQEMNREANTIGSKCQSAETAHIVVDLKSEIEKIREQIQNVE